MFKNIKDIQDLEELVTEILKYNLFKIEENKIVLKKFNKDTL